jgi:serine/threonine-protein kinase
MKKLDVLPGGTRLGKYEIVRLLGAGGMGAVYEGIHLELKKRVALKTLHPDLAVRPLARQRFLREGEAASRIRHPHVVDVTDVDTQDDMPFLVMEFLEGVDLKQHIIQNGPMKATEAVDVVVPAVAAVAAGHDEGVIHRDLKPHNIFLARTRTGDIVTKVLDFGVSKLLDPATGGPSLTGTAAVMGTIAYMSPEQAKGAKFVDGRTDQYAMALILYECLTGRRPHRGENTLAILRQIGDGQIDPPSIHAGMLPPGLEAVILKGLALQKDDRFPSLYAFGRALLAFASERVRAQWATTFQREPSELAQSAWSEGAPDDAGDGEGEAEAALPEPPVQPRSRPGGDAMEPTALGTVALHASSASAGRASAGRPVGVGSLGARGGESTLGHSAGELSPRPVAKPGRRVPWAIAGGLAIAAASAGVVLVVVSGKRAEPPAAAPVSAPAPVAAHPSPAAPSPQPRLVRIELEVTPPEAEIELDGAKVGVGSLTRAIAADGRVHSLRVSAPGHVPQTLSFLDAPPPRTLTLYRTPNAPAAAAPRKSKPAKTGAAQPSGRGPAAPAGPRVGANQAPIIKE